MIDFRQIPSDGQTWRNFAMAVLTEMGFYVESSSTGSNPSDFVISETVKCKGSSIKFRWLVSAKRYQQEMEQMDILHEPNLEQRLRESACSGFIGFYPIPVWQTFTTYLEKLRDRNEIAQFIIYDGPSISEELNRYGLEDLLTKFFPANFTRKFTYEKIYQEYTPLCCHHCLKDMLPDLHHNDEAIITDSVWYNLEKNDTEIRQYYWFCSHECYHEGFLNDHETNLRSVKKLSELMLPYEYLNWLFSIMSSLKIGGDHVYSDKAYTQLQILAATIGQKVFKTSSVRQREVINALTDQRKSVRDNLLELNNRTTIIQKMVNDEVEKRKPKKKKESHSKKIQKKMDDDSQLKLF